MIKTIIFDMGQVLIKNKWKKISRNIEKKYGIPTLIYSFGNNKAIKEYKKLSSGKGSFERVFELMGANKKIIPKLIKDYKEEYNKNKIINEKLLDFIKKLKEDYKIICLTDTNKVHYEANNETRLFKDFDKVFASHLQGTKKEFLISFKKVLKELKNKPEQVLFIDDSKKNIKNAQLLGINSILYKDFPKIKKLKGEILKKLGQNVSQSF